MTEKIQEIKNVFQAPYDEGRRAALLEMPPAQVRYMIAFTPRSGSSYLCDVLRRAKRLGRPDELLSGNFLPAIRARLAPAVSADEYVDLVLRATCSSNGVAGFKASWFQFENFTKTMADPGVFNKFRFIHLTRRDLAAQAVSLYRATATGFFHTNKKHSPEELSALDHLEYDFEKIDEWCRHIEVQEQGWRDYFAKNNIFPLTVTYEEIEKNIVAVVQRISNYLHRPRAAESAAAESVFQKIGQRQSVEWASRFILERDERMRSVAAAIVS